jgi:hypothetical protein
MPDDQMTLGSSATLTAGVSSSATTLPLSAAIGVADGRTMRVVCEGEVMLVTAGMGTTSLTVTRGQEGTTAAAHPSSATVQQRLTPAGLANTRTQPNPHAHNGTDGSGTVAHSATTGRTANDHHAAAHSLTGADHTLSGLTTGHVLTATSPTAADFQAPSGGGAPAAHATTHQPGGTDALAVDAAAGTGSLRTLGTSGTSAAAGNDGRLSDARTPTTHASSHVGGGSDAIAAFVASGAGHKSGLVPDPGVTGGTTKYLREDSSWQVPPGGGGGTLTVEEVDGTPSVAATKLILPNGTVSVSGTEATYTPTGGGGGNVTSTGAAGSEPGSPTSGDLYLPNNGFSVERYSGSAWVPWGPLFPLTAPPTAGWSWVNQGSSPAAAVDTSKGGLSLSVDAAAAAFRMYVRSAPATPYTITAALLFDFFPTDYVNAGLVFYESGTGKIVNFSQIHNGTNSTFFRVGKMNSVTSFNSVYVDQSMSDIPCFGPFVMVQLSDDGTNRVCRFSTDGGLHFQQLHSVGRTDFLAGGANQIGLYVESHATKHVGVTLLSWAQS